MRSKSPQLITWLKAAGEPSRLRLIALCSQRDTSVSDLALALGQSEPRVSRHLKILCDAGLLERMRQGQWVHYRLTQDSAAASFVQGWMALLDQSDPVLVKDRARAQAKQEAGAEEAKTFESRLGRALGAFVEAGERSPSGSALVVGVEHLEVLESAAVK
jgi:DNA-binding transcriptional ArsR family regulator